jgi:hypothetical protein
VLLEAEAVVAVDFFEATPRPLDGVIESDAAGTKGKVVTSTNGSALLLNVLPRIRSTRVACAGVSHRVVRASKLARSDGNDAALDLSVGPPPPILLPTPPIPPVRDAASADSRSGPALCAP